MADAPRQVGEFPPQRIPINTRAPKNPIDKATIVSIYPRKISETKHTIDPSKFEIEPGRLEDPSILVVGSSSWWAFYGDGRPPIEVPISSVAIANSIIMDLSNATPECDMVDARPGLFFVPGEFNVLEVKTKFKSTLLEVAAKQKNWYLKLVRAADSLWARSNGNPLALSDEMRLAAQELNLKDKPWMMDFTTITMVPCVACGTLKNPAFPVCASCKAVDMSHPNAKELVFAKGQI